MHKEKFLIIPNNKELKLYNEYGFNAFILPLKDYSIGYDVYFDTDEVNTLSKSNTIYVLLNKFLHKKIYDFEKIYNQFDKNIMFIVEDIGLVNIIDKSRVVLWENHILSNYKAINFLNNYDIKSVVINNDLTIGELETIIENTTSNIFYHYLSKNILMYSKRNLVDNYNEYYNILNNKNSYLLSEKVSNKKLFIKDEYEGSTLRYDKIFCASKYLDKLKKFNLIIDLTNIDDDTTKEILNNYNNKDLYILIESDYYFLEHDIKYKVGDLK